MQIGPSVPTKSNVTRPLESRQNLRCAATQQAALKAKPDWTGDSILSHVVNAAIGFKPLYSVMKVIAKQIVQNTAEQNGVPWRQRLKELSATPEIYQIKEEIEDNSICYPSYYLQSFHAYENGNLDWTAAFENESATAALAWRVYKDPAISAPEALEKMRSSVCECLEGYERQNGAIEPKDILDVGCSVGVSSRIWARRYPQAQVTGLDLSPHFLAVAEHRERTEDTSSRRRIQYIHCLAEASGLPSESMDVVSSCFVIHECPPFAIEGMIKEAMRLLRPGGRLMIVDNNPASETIQKLPPVLFTLMKSTEPWSDVYYQMDVEAAMRAADFQDVVTLEPDHRHRAVMGIKALK